jgi:glycosyltransferase involved in cell wall biosynthesis
MQVAIMRKAISPAPFVSHVHGTTVGASLTSDVGRAARPFSVGTSLAREKLTWRLSDRVVAVSDNIATELRSSYGVPGDKIVVVYNGVDVDVFRPVKARDEIRKSLGWQGRKVALFVGRVGPLKGIKYLIDAARIVRTRHEDVLFVVVGGVEKYQGKEAVSHLAELKEKVEFSAMTDFFVFAGGVPNSKLPEVYSAADLFVFPSLYEGMPKAVLEAMSCEKPCVATCVGGIPALVGPDEGILVPPANAEELAAGIEEVLADDGRAERMGKQAREKIVENFTWSSAARKLLEVYREL